MACGATLKRTYEFDLLHSPPQPPIKRRCMPLSMAQSPSSIHQVSPSVSSAASPKLTKEEITARIESELKRMQKRKQLFYSPHSPSQASNISSQSGHQSPPVSSAALTSSITLSDIASPSSASGTVCSKQKDVPLFTFKQVAMICERMVKEHEDQLRETYEKALSSKMSEQYESFLRFNHDQLHKHFGSVPSSYVS
ncbi:unnamed protein product [Candidula unifasciata]|uniref:Akirin n=1 Tax=Candidula unifasciata TaxID=100452 RepID=A0A8S3ZIP5_9EUPU|nr:unnamed protein product [Candidula unifasciata]